MNNNKERWGQRVHSLANQTSAQRGKAKSSEGATSLAMLVVCAEEKQLSLLSHTHTRVEGEHSQQTLYCSPALAAPPPTNVVTSRNALSRRTHTPPCPITSQQACETHLFGTHSIPPTNPSLSSGWHRSPRTPHCDIKFNNTNTEHTHTKRGVCCSDGRRLTSSRRVASA